MIIFCVQLYGFKTYTSSHAECTEFLDSLFCHPALSFSTSLDSNQCPHRVDVCKSLLDG